MNVSCAETHRHTHTRCGPWRQTGGLHVHCIQFAEVARTGHTPTSLIKLSLAHLPVAGGCSMSPELLAGVAGLGGRRGLQRLGATPARLLGCQAPVDCG